MFPNICSIQGIQPTAKLLVLRQWHTVVLQIHIIIIYTRNCKFLQTKPLLFRWAKPESMSRAGFYHEPTSTNDDRSMCFTCNVCLVCWERTDEPWSEHERHQPNCPYIKGSPTQNVPLSVYYASQPAIKCEHKVHKLLGLLLHQTWISWAWTVLEFIIFIGPTSNYLSMICLIK